MVLTRMRWSPGQKTTSRASQSLWVKVEEGPLSFDLFRMGNLLSITKVMEGLGMAKDAKGTAKSDDSQHTRNLPNIDKSRLVELLQALKQLARLQQEASNAQIDARQKMREVSLKRNTVWTSDAAFMREVQTPIGCKYIRKLERVDHTCDAMSECARWLRSFGTRGD